VKVKGVSDISGAYWNDNGIDIEAAIRFKDANGGRLNGFKGAEPMPADDLLTSAVDLLVPAAVENVITNLNADRIQAKLIVEGANGPTSASADDQLNEKGILVVPDILANAGGVTVSYFEWVQNRMGFKWDLETVNQRADHIMTEAFNKVYATSQRHGVSLRIAAYIVAIDKVATTYRFRGGF
jgi:glutamate dehydrogenase (NAD(P)+)